MKLTPGLRYIGQLLVAVVAPSAALVLLAYRFGALSILPVWQTSALLAAAPPLAFFFKVSYDRFSQRRRADALGARLLPCVKGKWPGNVDIMRTFMSQVETDYMGNYPLEVSKDLGAIFNLHFLWDDVVMTHEPSHVKTILATDFNNWVKGEQLDNSLRSLLGTGVFNSDGDLWKLHRSMTRPFFTHDRIGHFDIFDTHADTAIRAAKDRLRSGRPIDFQDLISRFTLDSATEFLFANCSHTLHTPLPYPFNAQLTIEEQVARKEGRKTERFAEAFGQAQLAVAKRQGLGGVWPLFETLEDRTEKPMGIVFEFLEPIVEEAIRKREEEACGTSKLGEAEKMEVQEGDTLLDHLVRLTTDRVVLRDEVLNIMLAGRDTTASTLTSTIYFMAMYPHVMDRLREEVLTKVGPSRRPTYDDIRDMKYLRAVLNETLRLFPPVPFNIRQTTKDTTLPSPEPDQKPVFIPRDTAVIYSVMMMHRRKDLWGPDADEYDPDRFIDERLHKYIVPNPFIFLPFNAGPRICLGQQFAYNEMSFMLIRLLQNFSRIELAPEALHPDAHPPEHWKSSPGRAPIERFHPRSHLTLYAKGGMWVRMTEAEQV
ncbi:cytochrome P450 monooxygenase pc-3 [Coniophora puteana RWD-64-598 SS2]|uniref:Cytochrome P450 monooxygenase pc-3 n=1 Tax=Coniophora puteana (strain RWD-64-598) TaxID=741705 RepID=A0A5M3MZC5_CONPW|nr:cytochrome P450 monooxygenase pc-3 [Coniophora puteana RWD-64-598 SS2]EIW84500.1 cytochrome P450 monooxygenase pc-3 [Coniophora puteana RWD-64-598 SS2]